MRIIISEEDEISRYTLASTLRHWGYEVWIARDIYEVWEMLNRSEMPPIAVLDWPRSRAETPELLCQIQQLPEWKQPYLVILTPKGREQDLVAGLWAGADDYLAKPFNVVELRSRIQVGERVVKLQHQLRESSLKASQAV